jgi:hypothetical protein
MCAALFPADAYVLAKVVLCCMHSTLALTPHTAAWYLVHCIKTGEIQECYGTAAATTDATSSAH